MALINPSYLHLTSSYLFSEIGRKVREFEAGGPEKRIIRMGIGDVTEPLPAACIAALHAATDELADASTFRGYGPEQGYDFLRHAIAQGDFESLGVHISPDEIFVSDGAKCDSGNFQELFSADAKIGIPDPVYPVYLDSNVMAGRTGPSREGRYEGIHYLDTSEESGYLPRPPSRHLDVVYLCSPNNPTGAVFTRSELSDWVAYAKEHRTILLFDAAYAAFVQDESLPRSIFEIEDARTCAVEFRSFSKTAGFTGTRCAYVAIPKECMVYDNTGAAHSLHSLWLRRQSTKFNGVSYPVQRAAAAVYSEEGKIQVSNLIAGYMDNASIIISGLKELGLPTAGGVNSPYVWVNTGRDSWEYFDDLLHKAAVVCTPGVGFGRCGQGYVRFSAFNSRENVVEAMERVKANMSV